jgi:hypothetical protein
MGTLRALAELANLIELFVIDKTSLKEWLGLSAEEKWWRFRPKRVQERIAKTKNRPIVDKETYSKLCEIGVHVSPGSARLSHQFEGSVHVGGEFSAPAFLMILNELAIILSASLKVTGHFIHASADRISQLTEAGNALEQTATSWLRITNYEERMRESRTDKDL